MIFESIKSLVSYGIEKGLIEKEDSIYATNRILEVLNLNEYSESECNCENIDLEKTLNELTDFAFENGLLDNDSIDCRDLFDTKLMACLIPYPHEIIKTFYNLYKDSPEKATDYYYSLSKNSNYIREYRIKKDMRWSIKSEYGDIDISINLSKPEKDPKAIAAAKLQKQSGYPKCLLCKECEGFTGNASFPARQNHRIIPITINNTSWGFQYSPYVYYNEHCIVFNGEHIPMKIEKATFIKLFDFVKMFPNYFLGSNADLPIVGGSILTHDHYQGGRYTFAMAKAPIEKHFAVSGFEDVEAGIVKWPLSVIRLRSESPDRLIEIGTHVLSKWQSYTDEEAFIFADTNGENHNTITPIARKVGNTFELDLALRNNITTEKYPMGLYHPHEQYHNIKKENIGLIEVMGLAVLPSRLQNELTLLSDYIIGNKDIRSEESIKKHADWVDSFKDDYTFTQENVMDILKEETGKVFVKVLENAGVFKCDELGRKYFSRFIQSL